MKQKSLLWLLLLVLTLAIGLPASADELPEPAPIVEEVLVEAMTEPIEPEPIAEVETPPEVIEEPAVTYEAPMEDVTVDEIDILAATASLSAPTGLVATQISESSIDVSWNGVDGATGYALYRQTNTGAWVEVRRLAATTLRNNNMRIGNSYTFKVCAYDAAGDGPFCDTVTVLMQDLTSNLPAPTLADIENLGGGSVMVSWSAVEGADGYQLYRSVNGGSFTMSHDVTTTSQRNNNLVEGSTYEFKVCAYQTTNGTKELGEYSQVKSILVAPVEVALTAPVITYAQMSPPNVSYKFTWDPVEGADKYEVSFFVLDTQEYYTTILNAKSSGNNYIIGIWPYELPQVFNCRAIRYKANNEIEYGPMGTTSVYVPPGSGPMPSASEISSGYMNHPSSPYIVLYLTYASGTDLSDVHGIEIERAEGTSAATATNFTTFRTMLFDKPPTTTFLYRDYAFKANTYYMYRIRHFRDTPNGREYGDLIQTPTPIKTP